VLRLTPSSALTRYVIVENNKSTMTNAAVYSPHESGVTFLRAFSKVTVPVTVDLSFSNVAMCLTSR
jgi:hypothetical protein